VGGYIDSLRREKLTINDDIKEHIKRMKLYVNDDRHGLRPNVNFQTKNWIRLPGSPSEMLVKDFKKYHEEVDTPVYGVVVAVHKIK
jgi:hypothetical protein